MRNVLPVAVAFLLAACTSTPAAQPAPSSSATATTSSSAKPSSAPGLHEEWKSKFSTVLGSSDASCAPVNAKSKACADYLTEIVMLALELERAIKARPDSDRYVDTLVAIGEVTDASEEYAPCSRGQGTIEQCHAEAITILFAPITVPMKLNLDEMSP
ncbi:hypothetical protein JOF41_007393 [Saccharothrix coeruleofusca]|uniref:hypothetical protein n=1 Tax=Saccharothrix coeruleofusca TaxID=33919 RepID=UPI001AE37F06|nr:hypothetical protein [Saccharothrix coeruleofusca]MBP2341139.1 hypothetical protein [Saccharothrix coeruleofusca]